MANTHGTQGTGGQGSGNIRDRAEQTGASLGAAAGRAVGEAAERAQQATGSTLHRAQDTASNLGQRVQDTASNLKEKAQDAASNVAQRAQDLASSAADKANEAFSSVGDRLSSWGNQLREGPVGAAATNVGEGLEAGQRYIQQHNFGEMTDDLAAVVRHYPIQSLLIAFGVGCFLGMASRR